MISAMMRDSMIMKSAIINKINDERHIDGVINGINHGAEMENQRIFSIDDASANSVTNGSINQCKAHSISIWHMALYKALRQP